MKVGDLIKRRTNGDLALILSISNGELRDSLLRMRVVRIACKNIQYVWGYEYEVISESR